MQLHRSRTALVTTLLAAAAATGGAFVACAQGGSPGSTLQLGDASTETGGSTYDSSSSSGSSSGSGGGGCDANTQTDWTNCGSCGNVCPTGDICNAGQCQKPCTAPQVECPGEPGCFDLTSDMQNCGTCGTACIPPAGGTVTGIATCAQSQCLFSCPADAGVPDGGGSITQCEADGGGTSGCFDLTSTSDHCGACGTQCPSGDICTQSQCCPSGDAYCGGQCIDVSTDPNNCGACNASCPSPAQCAGGKCTGYTTSNPTAAFLDACTMTGSVAKLVNSTNGWAASTLLTLPFSFTFYGTAETQFWLMNQGAMGIGPPQSFPPPEGYPDCTGGGDPTTAYPAAVIFGDEELATGQYGVCYATAGTAPNQQLVATWKQVTDQTDPGSSLTFSIVLTQTTNTIDFMYLSASVDGGVDSIMSGSTATVGLQGKAAGTFTDTAFSCAKPFLTTTPFDVRFTPVP